MFTTYVLRSESSGRFYVGATANLERRLAEHNDPRSGTTYTKGHGPWELVYREEFEDLSEARRREREVKSWKSRRSIEQLIQGR